MIDEELIEDADRDLCGKVVPAKSNQNNHPIPPDTRCVWKSSFTF